jgi:hypothetical protein
MPDGNAKRLTPPYRIERLNQETLQHLIGSAAFCQGCGVFLSFYRQPGESNKIEFPEEFECPLSLNP